MITSATQKLKVLAGNGEFKGELGEMRVRVSLDAEGKTITVSDNGIGMTAEEVEKYINQIAFSGAEEFLEKHKIEELLNKYCKFIARLLSLNIRQCNFNGIISECILEIINRQSRRDSLKHRRQLTHIANEYIFTAGVMLQQVAK